MDDGHASDQARGTETLAATLASMLDPHVLLEAVQGPDGTVVDVRYAMANDAACDYLQRAKDGSSAAP